MSNNHSLGKLGYCACGNVGVMRQHSYEVICQRCRDIDGRRAKDEDALKHKALAKLRKPTPRRGGYDEYSVGSTVLRFLS